MVTLECQAMDDNRSLVFCRFVTLGVFMSRQQVLQLLQLNDTGSFWGHFVAWFLMLLIILNVLAVILGSMPSVEQAIGHYLTIFFWFSMGIFTLEYVLRLWSVTALPDYAHPFFGRWRYFCRPLMLLELIILLPFYLSLFFGVTLFDTRFLRVFMLLRIFRLSQFKAYQRSLQLLVSVVRAKREELILAVLLIGFTLIVLSCIMYLVENKEQPEVFGSIPEAMWWAVITMTTVGYGDAFPVTAIGRFLASIASLLGVGLVALPSGILASGFIEQIQKRKEQAAAKASGHCPCCGQPLPNQKA
jgi:voltage-gated potassium channel